MKLNKSQIKYLLNTAFESYELYDTFDTTDIEWLSDQEVEIYQDPEWVDGWYALEMNGRKMSTLNFKTYPERLRQLRYLK